MKPEEATMTREIPFAAISVSIVLLSVALIVAP